LKSKKTTKILGLNDVGSSDTDSDVSIE